MVKWATNWSEAQTYRTSDGFRNTVVWAIRMPKTYPECRVTRRGVAFIAVTDEETMVTELREDGGEVKLMP